MAKDLDFKPRRKPATAQNQPAPVQSSKKVRRETRASWSILLIVIGLVLIFTALYYQSLKTTSSATTINPLEAQDASTQSTNVPSTNDETGLVINVYDGGAGSEATEAAVKKLEESGYQVKNLGKSQLEYDQTYVWYQEEFSEEIQGITDLLSNRTITLKETKSFGVFDIQIQLGKK
jgi:hypothetical protein